MLFIAFNAINGTVKIFQVESELPTMPGSGGDQAYKIFEDNVVHNFEKNARIGINELMAWSTETQCIQEFFTFTELVNTRLNSK